MNLGTSSTGHISNRPDIMVETAFEPFDIRTGLALQRSNHCFDSEIRSQHAGSDCLKFHFKLSGVSAISYANQEAITVDSGLFSFLVQPNGSSKQEWLPANSHQRAVTLHCSREFAASIIPQRTGEVPTPISDFLRGDTSFHFAAAPLPPQMRILVEEILRGDPEGALQQMLIEAKALELLYHTLERIFDDAGKTSLRPRDEQRVRALCAMIDDDPASHTSIAELSHQLAWNESQLMRAFKQATGMTIATYRQHARMERARCQLHESDLSVTEIAFDAGYEHSGNFATAFRRAFGCSPRELR